MQFEIEKKNLQEIIFLAQTVAEKKTNMPYLINLLLEAENDHIKVFATDLEISIAAKAPAKVITSGKATVHAKYLNEIVKELNDLPIKITLQDNFWVQLQQKRYQSKLQGSDPNQYPVFPVIGSCDFIKIQASLLKEMISKVIFCISNDDTRYHLNAVHLERYWEDKKFFIKMTATDGHRLAVVTNPVDKVNYGEDNSKLHGVIIPRKGLNELSKLLETVENSVEIAIEGAQLVVKYKDTVLLIRLIEGKYPNFLKFIPQKINYNIIVPRQLLYSAVKRVSFHAHQKSKSIVLEFSKSKVQISTSGQEIGEAFDEIEVDYDGENFKANLNARYLMEMLSADNSELVDLQLMAANAPFLVRPHDKLNYTCVIMPMKY